MKHATNASLLMYNDIFQHYHFVTAGLSDLYADDRVRFPYFDGLSGFGIELTMKVIKTDESSIPQWPVALLQRLARYIFGKPNPNQYLG